jgi:16S rRNA (guanine527-N7)-methyltransferase
LFHVKQSSPSTPEAFQGTFNVSRETLERLKAYADLLIKWNPRINLVSPETIPILWARHLADSAQLFQFIPQNTPNLLDVGVGAGFPGLVLSIMGIKDVHLVESDQRKVAFLREAARITAAQVTIHGARIEQVPPFIAGTITARALAPLSKLLDWTAPFRGPETLSLFLKGQTVEAELTETHKQWTMVIDRYQSLTDVTGTILALREVRRVRDPFVADEPATPRK